jgi:hypothetical protein
MKGAREEEGRRKEALSIGGVYGRWRTAKSKEGVGKSIMHDRSETVFRENGVEEE